MLYNLYQRVSLDWRILRYMYLKTSSYNFFFFVNNFAVRYGISYSCLTNFHNHSLWNKQQYQIYWHSLFDLHRCQYLCCVRHIAYELSSPTIFSDHNIYWPNSATHFDFPIQAQTSSGTLLSLCRMMAVWKSRNMCHVLVNKRYCLIIYLSVYLSVHASQDDALP